MNLKGKGSQAKNRYNRELESYKWFVVDLKENKAITGYEYKSDALDILSDYDDQSRYKVVSEISLKKLGIENPKEMWKYKMAIGGNIPYDLKVTGIYTFKTISGKEYKFAIIGFEREDDTEWAFYFSDWNREENNGLRSVIVKNSAIRKMAKGETVTATTKAGEKGKLTRVGDSFMGMPKMADGGSLGQINSLEGSWRSYNKGVMSGKKDEGYITIKNEEDLNDYITSKIGNVVKDIKVIEKGKDYPYNRSNPYFEDTYLVTLKNGTTFEVERSYGRPNWSGNVDYVENIRVKNINVKYADRGRIDLFQDYQNIPDNVQKVLNKYAEKYDDDFSEMDYNDMSKMKKDIEKLGYTFDSGLDNEPYGLRPIGVKITELEGFEDFEEYAKGGGLGNENALMVSNNNKQIFHHTKEMSEALKGVKNVPAWVVAKVNRSASDLSDATHYLEGAEGMYADGGETRRKFIIVDEYTNKVFDKEFYDSEDAWRFLRQKFDNTDELSSYSVIDTLDAEKYYADGGGVEDLTPVELYFRNLDYSKLPESFSNFIKTEILTDPELKYLSEREPIFIEIKEKVEKYENQNAGKVEEAEGESISDLIAGLEVLVPISTKKEKKELLDLIEGLKLLL